MAILRIARMQQRRRRKQRLAELRESYHKAKTDDGRNRILEKLKKVAPTIIAEEWLKIK